MLLSLALCLLVATVASAQEEKLSVKLTGRLLLDAAAMGSSDETADNVTESGVAIPDVRLGLKANYGKWVAKIDAGYARQSLSLKDVFIEYNFNAENLIRGGYFVHQFSYQSATSSSFKVSMEEPATSCLSNPDRRFGVMFEHYADAFLATLSLHADNQSVKKATNETNRQGIGFMTRMAYHPKIERGNLLHMGIGLSYEKASKNQKNMRWTANYPTRVGSLTAIGTEMTDAQGDLKAQAEFMVSKKHVALETQATYLNVQRKASAPNYNAWGAYANLRFLFSNQYCYNKSVGGIDTPSPKSWEMVAAFNHTNMNDGSTRGGRLNSWSLTLNRYINKYMVWRLSSHYVTVGSNNTQVTATPNANRFWVIETRLQFKI